MKKISIISIFLSILLFSCNDNYYQYTGQTVIQNELDLSNVKAIAIGTADKDQNSRAEESSQLLKIIDDGSILKFFPEYEEKYSGPFPGVDYFYVVQETGDIFVHFCSFLMYKGANLGSFIRIHSDGTIEGIDGWFDSLKIERVDNKIYMITPVNIYIFDINSGSLSKLFPENLNFSIDNFEISPGRRFAILRGSRNTANGTDSYFYYLYDLNDLSEYKHVLLFKNDSNSFYNYDFEIISDNTIIRIVPYSNHMNVTKIIINEDWSVDEVPVYTNNPKLFLIGNTPFETGDWKLFFSCDKYYNNSKSPFFKIAMTDGSTVKWFPLLRNSDATGAEKFDVVCSEPGYNYALNLQDPSQSENFSLGNFDSIILDQSKTINIKSLYGKKADVVSGDYSYEYRDFAIDKFREFYNKIDSYYDNECYAVNLDLSYSDFMKYLALNIDNEHHIQLSYNGLLDESAYNAIIEDQVLKVSNIYDFFKSIMGVALKFSYQTDFGFNQHFILNDGSLCVGSTSYRAQGSRHTNLTLVQILDSSGKKNIKSKVMDLNGLPLHSYRLINDYLLIIAKEIAETGMEKGSQQLFVTKLESFNSFNIKNISKMIPDSLNMEILSCSIQDDDFIFTGTIGLGQEIGGIINLTTEKFSRFTLDEYKITAIQQYRK